MTPPYIPTPLGDRVLIICGSPLQVMIAERVIAMHPETRFDGMLVSASLRGRSDKYDYYLSRLKACCRKTYYIHREEGIGRARMYLETFRHIMLGSRLPRYDTIFLGPATPDIEPILYRQQGAEIITMDEGAANLVKASYQVLMSRHQGGLTHFLKSRFGMMLQSEFRTKASQHITIYKSGNINVNSSYVSVLEGNMIGGGKIVSQTIRLMMGQPIYEMDRELRDSEQLNKLKTQQVVDKYQIDKYLPHPRETYQIRGVEYIKTPKVFEDYIVSEMAANPETKYEVYSFGSSCVFNVPQSSQLEFKVLKPSDSPKCLDEVYTLIEQMGIPVELID